MTRSAQNVMEPLEGRRLLSATRIMPLGDSITESFTGRDSYRYWLWKSLQRAGYRNVDFVGSVRGTRRPDSSKFDQDHEGHAGWTADRLLASLKTLAKKARPDIVLLHIGTNDLRFGESAAGTAGEIGKIIDVLRGVNRRIVVLLSTIIPNHGDRAAVDQLNAAIRTLADAKNSSSSPVRLVDQAAGFDVSRDTLDGLHPNTSGERKMSAKFFRALKSLLSRNE